MTSRKWLREHAIYGMVVVIAILLVSNIYLIYLNTQRIEYNKNQYQAAEKVKVNTVDVIRNLHLLDMALRSYALVEQDKYLQLADSCLKNKDITLKTLESALSEQGYEMWRFEAMRDSVNKYYAVTIEMRKLLAAGEFEQFRKVLEPDPGYEAWSAYLPFSDHVFAFENDVSAKAQQQYREALTSSYWLQVVIFLITVPTLAYTAYNTKRSLTLTRNVNVSMRKNLRTVAEQKAELEKMVQERTREILKQKEEIGERNRQLMIHQREIESQRNELREQNEELQNAKRIIELQHQEIKRRHDELAIEVDKATQDLKRTNLELIEHNNRLEQFTFIISHNLRAPMARLTGLASLLDHVNDEGESKKIIQMMVRSTGELDQVIKDLGLILGVQKTGMMPIEEVDLDLAVQKVLDMLEVEVSESNARIERDLKVRNFYSLKPYVDSIIYNLISNALKYQHPDRSPVVKISSTMCESHLRIDIADNGLGIDLKRNGENLFNIYKRFHFHVEGKGLGLYLVKSQVMALGGKIEVSSDVDKGTTFSVFLNPRLNGKAPSDTDN